MEKTPYTAGNWWVKAGHEEEFAKRWEEFAQWSKATVPGSLSFLLIQSTDDSRHFISQGAWTSSAAIWAWRELPEFKQALSELRGLCDDLKAGDFTLTASSES